MSQTKLIDFQHWTPEMRKKAEKGLEKALQEFSDSVEKHYGKEKMSKLRKKYKLKKEDIKTLNIPLPYILNAYKIGSSYKGTLELPLNAIEIHELLYFKNKQKAQTILYYKTWEHPDEFNKYFFKFDYKYITNGRLVKEEHRKGKEVILLYQALGISPKEYTKSVIQILDKYKERKKTLTEELKKLKRS